MRTSTIFGAIIGAAAMLAAAALTAVPGAAQDMPNVYENAVPEFGQRQLHDSLARRRLEQAQGRRAGAASAGISPKTRAICRDKARVAAGLPAAKGRQLIALCTRAGL